MIKLRAPGPSPVRIRPVQPSAALAAWYETELDKLIAPMCADVAKALLPIWHSAPKPVLFMTFPHGEVKFELDEIETKWQRVFAEKANALALGMTKRVLEYYDFSFADALTKAGIGIPKSAMDGDVEGHSFHGNRYTGGIGGGEKAEYPGQAFKDFISASRKLESESSSALESVTTSLFDHQQYINQSQRYVDSCNEAMEIFTLTDRQKDMIESERGDHYSLIDQHQEAMQNKLDVGKKRDEFEASVMSHAAVGNGYVNDQPIIMQPWMTPAQMDFVEIHNAVLRVAPTVGVRPERVLLSTTPYDFSVGGVNMTAAGSASVYNADPRITIYVPARGNHDDARLALVLAHESGHIIYEGAHKELVSEMGRMVNDPRMTTERVTGKLSPDGTPRNGAEKWYPITAALQPFHKDPLNARLKDEASVTKYAEEYQQAALTGKVSWHDAFHESFAEVHASRTTGNKVERTEDSPAWDEYHDAIMKVQKEKNLAVDTAIAMDARKDFRVKFDFTKRLQETAQAHIDDNIALIRSIPEQFHKRVKRMAWKSIESGRDIAGFINDLENEFDISLRRASLIARDQNNKMTAMFHRTRRLDLGLTTAIWRHTHASLHPREEHIDFDGESYSIEEGMYSEEEGENVWPGTMICCGCVDETIIPGYEEN